MNKPHEETNPYEKLYEREHGKVVQIHVIKDPEDGGTTLFTLDDKGLIRKFYHITQPGIGAKSWVESDDTADLYDVLKK